MGASLLTTVLPILVAAIASLVLTALATLAARGRPWLAGLPAAAALAAAAVAWAMVFNWDYNAVDIQHRLGLVMAGATVLFAALSGGEGGAVALVNGILALVVVGASCQMLFGRHPDFFPIGIGSLALAVGVAAGITAWLAELGLRRIHPAVGRLVVGIAVGAAAPTLAALWEQQWALLAGALAAALGLPILLAFWRGTSAGIAAAAVCGLAVLLAMDCALAPLDQKCLTLLPVAAALGLALMSGNLARIPWLAKRPIIAGVAATVATAALSGAGFWWAEHLTGALATS